MEVEEDSAAQRDCGGFLESVEANCGMLVKESALKDRDVCIGVLSALRELNNTVNQRLLEASKLLNSYQNELDKAIRMKQNFAYQRTHLQKALNGSSTGAAEHEHIELRPMEEFRNSEFCDSETVSDSHRLMLARLQDELGERKRLVTELELLKETKFNLENENSSLQRTLDNIDEKIKSATSVMSPLIKDLGLFPQPDQHEDVKMDEPSPSI